MSAVATNIINLFNSLPEQEQAEVRLAINKDSALRAELNSELEQSKKSQILTDAEAKSRWERLGVKTI